MSSSAPPQSADRACSRVFMNGPCVYIILDDAESIVAGKGDESHGKHVLHSTRIFMCLQEVRGKVK
jgi:hypothetical protein